MSRLLHSTNSSRDNFKPVPLRHQSRQEQRALCNAQLRAPLLIADQRWIATHAGHSADGGKLTRALWVVGAKQGDNDGTTVRIEWLRGVAWTPCALSTSCECSHGRCQLDEQGFGRNSDPRSVWQRTTTVLFNKT